MDTKFTKSCQESIQTVLNTHSISQKRPYFLLQSGVHKHRRGLSPVLYKPLIIHKLDAYALKSILSDIAVA